MDKAVKNTKIAIVVAIVIFIIMLIGIAFAYFSTTLSGSREYVIRVGSLDLNLTETNQLTLTNTIPTADSTGRSSTGFRFSLTNNASVNTDYTIYLDDVALSSGQTRLSDAYVRYNLTKNSSTSTARDLTAMGTNPNRVVDSGTIAPDATINYTLRLWLDYDATVAQASGKTFKAKLRVAAKQSAS